MESKSANKNIIHSGGGAQDGFSTGITGKKNRDGEGFKDEPVADGSSGSAEKNEETGVINSAGKAGLDVEEGKGEKEEKEEKGEIKEMEGRVGLEEKVEEVEKVEKVEKVEEVEKVEKKGVCSIDYSSYTKVQLINAFRKLLSEFPDKDIRHEAEAIRSCFYKLHNADLQDIKRAFIEGGGKEEDFVTAPDLYEQDLKNLQKEYRNMRVESNKKKEAIKEENYRKKLEVIEGIKALISSEESINVTFSEFKKLQNTWRDIGQIPHGVIKDMWENYHHHVELFYDYVKINRELRDLDLQRNMEQKTQLCTRAEELAVVAKEGNTIDAFRKLQKLHESWRETGPVPRDKRESLWNRFKEATSVVNKQHFDNEREKQKNNLEKKLAMCESAEAYSSFDSTDPREWNVATKKILALQKEWRTVGYAPRKSNTKVWSRFRKANDIFFQRKREFWVKSKEQLHKNLALKIEICEQAELLKDSEEWKAASKEFIELQRKWKEVGPVPRKDSDTVWKRFRAACDEFFNKKDKHFLGVAGEQGENLKAKEALMEEVSGFQSCGNAKEDIRVLNEFSRQWSEIGFVPLHRKDDMQMRFRELLNTQYDKIEISERERNIHKFKNKVAGWISLPRGWDKIEKDRERIVSRLRLLESDLATLNNNIGFFGKSKGAESLIEGVNEKIEQLNEQIRYLKAKITIVDSLEKQK